MVKALLCNVKSLTTTFASQEIHKCKSARCLQEKFNKFIREMQRMQVHIKTPQQGYRFNKLTRRNRGTRTMHPSQHTCISYVLKCCPQMNEYNSAVYTAINLYVIILQSQLCNLKHFDLRPCTERTSSFHAINFTKTHVAIHSLILNTNQQVAIRQR